MSEMTMVERMARALIERIGSPWRYEDMDPSIKRLWQGHARAAIAAMREPTQGQLNAARDWSRAKYGKPIGKDAAIGCWQCMIDEALR